MTTSFRSESSDSSVPRIEDIYPLTPLQQGMLFHTLLDPGSGMYFVQEGFLFEGPFDEADFRRAWELVLARHAVLRTTVVSEDVAAPMAVISRDVPLPLEVLDWSDLEPPAQAAALADLAERDRRRGADFDGPSLSRITLVRLSEQAHQMIWSFHHLLLDGWSATIVLGELLAAYRAYNAGHEPRLGPARPYRDFVAWLETQDLAEAEGYWRSRLAGVAASTPLGVDRRTAEQGYDIHRASLSEEATEQLGALARRHNLTLNTVVQGAWAVVLSRYSGLDDVVFGVTTAGRPADMAGVDAMVGMFMNSTPARVRVDDDQALVGWLQGIQAEQVRARRFEHTPLVQIQSWSDVAPGLPLFESLLVFENYPTGELDEAVEGSGQRHDVRVVGNLVHQQTNYPLTVVALPGSPFAVSLDYDRSRFDRASIERLARHLVTVLEGMAADPRGGVSALPLIGADERRQLVTDWNQTAEALPAVGGVHELVAAHAARTPEAPALVYGEQRLTYGQMDARANRLARVLRTRGVGPEVVVGVCLERSADLVVAQLAVLKAGGAYLPLDPEYPLDRLAFMVTDSGVRVLVSDQASPGGLAARVEDAGGWVIRLDEPATVEALAAQPTWTPVGQTRPDQLAYVMYTSGSTGRPKGIGIAHAGVVSLVTAGSYAPIQSDDVVAQVASPSFDAATHEIWGALANGACLVGLDKDVTLSPPALTRELRRHRVTVLSITPPVFNPMAAAAPEAFRELRHLLFGGDAVDPVSVRRVLARGRPERLVHMYGPTETTTFATWQAVESAVGDRLPIGRPMANARVTVLDPSMDLVPVGVPGELFVGGIGMARGYVGRPDLTAERFVADPLHQGERLYRTGDRARWRSDGVLEFLGRVDTQVKVRGQRVEPGEVETALAAHPALAAAAVVARSSPASASGAGQAPPSGGARDDDAGELRLVGYVVAADPTAGIPAIDEIRQFLGQTLPPYMVPAVIVELDQLPLTPNGKVDRTGLPTPAGLRPQLTGEFTPARTPTEEVLAGVWAEVLGVDRVGATDNFFDLGGHSLLATQVVSRLRAIFGAEVTLSQLFDHPTIRGLATVVDGSAGAATLPPIQPVDRDRPLPLSFAQQRLWFLDQLEPGSVDYNVVAPLRFEGPLDVAALGAAWAAIVERHEVLRTRLVPSDGVAYQVIDPPRAFGLEVVDLTERSDPLAAAEAAVGEDAAAPFDLATEPLWRVRLLRIGPDDHVLSLVMHHLVADEWSLHVLQRELSSLYTALVAGEPAPLAPLTVQYADFAVWQRGWLQGDVRDRQLAYWRQRLAGAPSLELPGDRPRPAVRSSAGGVVAFSVPTETVAGLRVLGRDVGATLNMALLAGFDLLLSRYADQDDVVVGTPVANRNRAETEQLIGFFVNTVVMRADLSGDPTFAELVGRVRQDALGA